MSSVAHLAQNYKKLPDNWRPSAIISERQSLDPINAAPSGTKINPYRFKKMLSSPIDWNENYSFYKTLLLSSGVISALAITASSYLLGQYFNVELLSLSNPLFSVATTIAALAAFYITPALTYQAISPKITQSNLEETFLELKRNPLFLNAYNEAISDEYQITFESADRETFSHTGYSMAKIICEQNVGIIQVWNGKLSLEKCLQRPSEIYNKYQTDENPIVWSTHAIHSLLFEFCNAFQHRRFEKLIMQAYLAQISKEDYAINSEFIEFGSLALYYKIICYGLEHLGWKKNWFGLADNMYIKKVDRDEEVKNFKKQGWPNANTIYGDQITHAQHYRNQWFINPLTCWLDENELKLSLAMEHFRTLTAAEIKETIVDTYNEALNFSSNDFFYEFYKNKAVVREFQDMGLKFEQLTAGLDSAFTFHLASKRAYLWDYLANLTTKSKTFTQYNVNISDFEADYKGRCLLRMTKDYLEDMNRHGEEVTIKSIKEFLEARRSLILNKTAPLHPMWLLNHYVENKTS